MYRAPARRRQRWSDGSGGHGQNLRVGAAGWLGFLGDGSGLEEVGKVASVSRVGEIRTDVEDILPSAQIG